MEKLISGIVSLVSTKFKYQTIKVVGTVIGPDQDYERQKSVTVKKFKKRKQTYRGLKNIQSIEKQISA